MKHTNSYIKGHPNPQFTRTNFVNLDGIWDFAFDDANEGIKNKYFEKFPNQLQINVPFTYEYEASGIKDDKVHNIVWYRKKFNHKINENLTFIRFEGVDYDCNVYINGHYVGNHKGAYSRFSFDITNYLVDGENEIVVRAYDDFDCTHARGKQRWMDHNYECFYVQTTGIWKTVWLEEVAPTHIDNVRMTPSFKDSNVYMEYLLKGDLENVEVETLITFNDKIISKTRKLVTRNIFTQTIDITTDDATMKTFRWYPWSPNLYDVVFTVYKNNVAIDVVKSYFGIAEFKANGNTILINRDPLFAKLILDQGYFKDTGLTYTEEQCILDIKVMQELGLNGCRKHQKIECDLFYYYCDIMGYLLWQELPSAYEWKDQTIPSLSHEWLDILYQHHNHPCIMTDVIINESWGTMSILDHQAQQEFSKGLYHLTKSLEPNRFVISNDGWEHTESDLITVHNYASNKEPLMDLYEDFDNNFANGFRRVVHGGKVCFAEGYEDCGKPVLLSEFAGIAFSKDKDIGWGYGDLVKNEEEFLARFKGQIDAIIESRLFCGYCITQLSDVQQEVNGLVDENREYKVSKEKLIEILKRNF